MWNSGKNILWTHLSKIFFDELAAGGCKILPKITLHHIQLTPYSVMTVKYAAQVLSKTVSVALRKSGESTTETATFCTLMDSFFDCFNTRHQDEGARKRKTFLAPYKDQNDERFDWLENVFLTYFEVWEDSVRTREGSFSKSEKEKMFISQQTHKGLIISCRSLIECVKFLLAEGVEYVLAERFCQDVLEEYFGNQRKLGNRNDNPDIHQLGYNAYTLRIQKYILYIW